MYEVYISSSWLIDWLILTSLQVLGYFKLRDKQILFIVSSYLHFFTHSPMMRNINGKVDKPEHWQRIQK